MSAPAAREEIASLGAKFVGFIPEDGATKGGYARPLTPEEQSEQAKMVAEHIKGQDIVVTTAQIPGRAAPRIVSGAMVASMKAGSVILDMAAESGGNVEGSRAGETLTTDNGVTLIGAKNLPARLAPATSVLFAKNLMNFTDLLIAKGENGAELTIDLDDDLVKGALLTKDGKVVHPNLQDS